jgi:long-subunit fatty acid transport protein
MKKIILTVATIFAFGFANAQEKKESSEGFSKGAVFVSGAFSLSSIKDNNGLEVKTNAFEIAPQVHYFLTENISLGLGVGFGSKKSENKSAKVSDDSTVSFGLAGRYYFTPASKFSVFGQLAAEYASTKDNLSKPELKVNGFGAGLGLGLNYFVSSNFSIETSLAVLEFASAKSNQTGAENVTVFGFGGDWRAVSFGVNYKF